MGIMQKDQGCIISECFRMLSNDSRLGKGNAVKIVLYDKYLTLSNARVEHPIMLSYSAITNVSYGLSTVPNSLKSAVGRTLLGGVLFGTVGTIVGCLTSVQPARRNVFSISFETPKGERHIVQFEDTRRFKGEKLYLKLKELCGIQ